MIRLVGSRVGKSLIIRRFRGLEARFSKLHFTDSMTGIQDSGSFA